MVQRIKAYYAFYVLGSLLPLAGNGALFTFFYTFIYKLILFADFLKSILNVLYLHIKALRNALFNHTFYNLSNTYCVIFDLTYL